MVEVDTICMTIMLVGVVANEMSLTGHLKVFMFFYTHAFFLLSNRRKIEVAHSSLLYDGKLSLMSCHGAETIQSISAASRSVAGAIFEEFLKPLFLGQCRLVR